jgi:hypothetical protein
LLVRQNWAAVVQPRQLKAPVERRSWRIFSTVRSLRFSTLTASQEDLEHAAVATAWEEHRKGEHLTTEELRRKLGLLSSLKVQWQPSAARDLSQIDPPVQKRILAAVERFAQAGEGDVKLLRGKKPREYRLRVGGWRAG